MYDLNLKNCIPHTWQEARAYYAIWGDLFFEVPYYVKSYTITKRGIKVVYANGVSVGTYCGFKDTYKE